jgi:hypothetical protein
VYKQILINTELQIGTRGQKTELTWRSPLRGRRSALGCRAIEEGGGGGGGEEEEEKKRDKKKKKRRIRRIEEKG